MSFLNCKLRYVIFILKCTKNVYGGGVLAAGEGAVVGEALGKLSSSTTNSSLVQLRARKDLFMGKIHFLSTKMH